MKGLMTHPTEDANQLTRSREQAMEVFPSPHKVATTDAAVLRTAGLSARKGEYGEERSRVLLFMLPEQVMVP
jgi:3-methyladenine DNA glycosylase/8-oxoguanine DNA glycosylase